MKRDLIKFAAVAFLLFPIDYLFGQVKFQPFSIRDSTGTIYDADQFVIKADNKVYGFKMDTSSVEYKVLSQIDPNWIKSLDILKSKLEGEAKTVVIITLKKGRVRKLPKDMRNKFQ